MGTSPSAERDAGGEVCGEGAALVARVEVVAEEHPRQVGQLALGLLGVRADDAAGRQLEVLGRLVTTRCGGLVVVLGQWLQP